MRQVQTIVNDDEMYGLGLSLEKLSGEYTYGHSGGFAGYVTNAISHLKDNIQVIALTNTQSSTTNAASDQVMRLLYKLQDMKGVEYVSDEPYSGFYRNRWGDSVIVSIGDDLVQFGAAAVNPSKAWTRYKKEKQHVFRNTDGSGFGSPGERITFKNIKDGKATAIAADGGDAVRVY